MSLDTTFVIDLRRGHPAAFARAKSIEDSREPRCVTAPVAAEPLVGAHRFGGVHLEPNYGNWAVFTDTFPDGEWHWRPGFNLATVQAVQLHDRTMDQGRVGDALKVSYRDVDGKTRLKVIFEYFEGEHYYKDSGWKRIWTIHTLYDQAIERVDLDELHKLLADLVKVWYESHLRRTETSWRNTSS